MGEPQEVIADRLLDMLVPGRASSNSTITIHHDGKGTWIAVTACLIMLTMNLILGFLYVDLRRAQARTDDYVQTTYMLIPDLKKMVDEKLQQKHRENP